MSLGISETCPESGKLNLEKSRSSYIWLRTSNLSIFKGDFFWVAEGHMMFRLRRCVQALIRHLQDWGFERLGWMIIKEAVRSIWDDKVLSCLHVRGLTVWHQIVSSCSLKKIIRMNCRIQCRISIIKWAIGPR
jgi:hypothetical protein